MSLVFFSVFEALDFPAISDFVLRSVREGKAPLPPRWQGFKLYSDSLNHLGPAVASRELASSWAD